MPDVILPFPQEGRSDKETIQNVIDTVIRLRKELEFLLNNLDSQNVLEAATVKADWIYAGNIKASQIDVTEAKIQSAQIDKIKASQIDVTEAKIGTAQIETLTVGTNVVMGDNATISWSKVTGAPSIPSQYTDAQALSAWEASGYASYINASGMYSGKFVGGLFEVNPTGSPTLPSGITIGGYWNGSWKGQALKIAFDEWYNGLAPGTIINSPGGCDLALDTRVVFRSYADFSSSNVAGLESSGYLKGTAVSGSFTTTDGKTVTVSNGLVTGIA